MGGRVIVKVKCKTTLGWGEGWVWHGVAAIKILFLCRQTGRQAAFPFPEILNQTPDSFLRRYPLPFSEGSIELPHKGEFRFLKGPSTLNKHQAGAKALLVLPQPRVCNLLPLWITRPDLH